MATDVAFVNFCEKPNQQRRLNKAINDDRSVNDLQLSRITDIDYLNDKLILQAAADGRFFFANRENGLEATFSITGFVRDYVCCPPENRFRTFNTKGRERLKHQITLEGGPNGLFRDSLDGADIIEAYANAVNPANHNLSFERGENQFAPIAYCVTTNDPHYNTVPDVPVPNNHPARKEIRNAIQAGRFRFTEDNDVPVTEEYQRYPPNSNPTNPGDTELRGVDQGYVQRGHLVKVELNIRGDKIRYVNGGLSRYIKLIPHLDTISVVDASGATELVQMIREDTDRDVQGIRPTKMRYVIIGAENVRLDD